MSLTGPQKGAKSGKANGQIIFLHGYGADGADLLGLSDQLGAYLPNTRFLAPNAPERCINNPMGYQWFPIPWLDGSSEEMARAGQARAVEALNAYLDAQFAEVAPERTVIVGFSQGTMMALDVLPRRDTAVAGVVGFSGRLLAPEKLAAAARVRPPVLLVHGDADQMVPPSSLPEAADALVAAGFETYTHISKGMGHGIAPDGLGLCLQFAAQKLGVTLPQPSN
ncbi:dienelactone hydrolase family protein [Abyssibius alkaniclasticus]|uniref:alpha/beta hydrolase n=1 Tax=Abyssibius alkaniclasticus TaxID=2881234 RepID=UPI0023638C2F|nr:dienelactone hydrolase family protein [Abyssibius alkaniclasticus]UPH70475.1 dienelactone hydrolase family protein [Abyssibius alkaniclasticus]